MATNFTPIEQTLIDVLDEWVLRTQGVVLTQKNPLLFVEMLRVAGFEIIKAGDTQKVRHEHKVIKNEILLAYRTMTACKARLEQLELKDLLKEEEKNTEPVVKIEPTKREKAK